MGPQIPADILAARNAMSVGAIPSGDSAAFTFGLGERDSVDVTVTNPSAPSYAGRPTLSYADLVLSDAIQDMTSGIDIYDYKPSRHNAMDRTIAHAKQFASTSDGAGFVLPGSEYGISDAGFNFDDNSLTWDDVSGALFPNITRFGDEYNGGTFLSNLGGYVKNNINTGLDLLKPMNPFAPMLDLAGIPDLRFNIQSDELAGAAISEGVNWLAGGVIGFESKLGLKAASISDNLLLQELGPVERLLYGARVGEGLPGSAGIQIPGRPTVESLANLSAKHDVEFAVTYTLGEGKGGGGGIYTLFSGTKSSVSIGELSADKILISHTHPNGGIAASGYLETLQNGSTVLKGDQGVLRALQEAGSPQKVSTIIPLPRADGVTPPPFRFSVESNNLDYILSNGQIIPKRR